MVTMFGYKQATIQYLDMDGKPFRVVKYATDITTKKKYNV